MVSPAFLLRRNRCARIQALNRNKEDNPGPANVPERPEPRAESEPD